MARRRWPRRALIGLASLLAALVALVLAIVWIPALSQLVIREALVRWDAKIPARVEWRAITGSLGAGVGVDGLALIDGDGAPLIRVDSLELELRLAALLGKTARVERLELRGVDVWTDHEWADLGDPDAPPEPPKPGIGPDLPLTVIGDAVIVDARVWQDERALVEIGRADLHARGRGREAEASLALAEVELPRYDLRVDALALAAAWDSPVAYLERLEIAAPLVDVHRLEARYDVATRTGELSLAALAPLAALAERLEFPLDRLDSYAALTVRVELEPERSEAALGLRIADEIELHADASADSLDPLRGHAELDLDGPGLELDATRDAEPDRHEQTWSLDSPALARPLELAAALLESPTLAEIRGRLHAEGSCTAPSLERLDTASCPVELRLRDAAGFGVGVDELRLRARVEPLAQPLELDARLTARQLALGEQLELETVELDAHGTLARLRVALSGRGVHERVRLVGTVSLDDRVEIALDQLRLRSDRAGAPLSVELLAPTRIALDRDEGALDVDALALAAAGGRIGLDGRIGLAAEVASDARLAIAGVRLGRLDPLIPGPALAGVLFADAALSGTLAAPNLRLLARVRALAISTVDVGTVELALAFGRPLDGDGLPAIEPALIQLLAEQLEAHDEALADASLRACLRVHGPLAERMIVSAALPLELRGGPTLTRGEPLAVRVAVERLELLELGGLMPDTPSWWRQRTDDAAAPIGEPKLIPQGLVDLDLTLAGTSARPQLAALVRARRLVLDRTSLGSLRASIRYADGLAGVELMAKPDFAQIQVRGQTPVAIDLARRRFAWSARDDRHVASLDVLGLDLAQLRATLGPKLPALEQALAQTSVDGLVSLGVRATGSLAAPQLAVAVRAGRLQHAGEALGTVRLFADYADGEATADLWFAGPLARRLDVHVAAPLELRPLAADQPVRVDLHRPLVATLDADALSLAALGRELGGPPLTGRLDAALALTGTLAEPSVELAATVEQLGRSDARIGDLLIHAGFADGRARLDADLVRAGTQVLAAAVELPVTVELTPGLSGSSLRWDRDGRHRLFATARGIDEALISAALGEVRESPVSSVVAAKRELDLAFDIAGGGSVEAFRLDGAVVGRVEVDDELALALDARLDLDQASQRLGLTLTPTHGPPLRAAVELEAEVPRLVAGEQRWGAVPFALDLSASNFELRSLASLLPPSVLDPRGILHGTVTGRGPIESPTLSGRLALEHAAITVVPMRQRLTGVTVELAFDERRVSLHQLALKAGRGGLRAEGWAELADAGAITAELEVEIDDFPLVRPGLPAMTVDTGVDVMLERASDRTRVIVNLDHPEVIVAGTNEGAPKPIPHSDDVVFVRASEARATDEAAPPGGERLLLQVVLLDPLLITGNMIDMAWTGALELELDGGAVDIGGQLDARRGRLRLFGNSFAIRRGVVTLPADGELDPFLDLEAVADLPEAEVTVTVRGRLSRPALEFSSSPALSDYQILTLLITGSTELQEGEGDVAAKAASLLAAVSNPEIANALQRSLGLDRVSLGFGENVDQPILTVGKRITRYIYVETSYHHNAPPDQNTTQIAVEYDFRPRWVLESYFGDAAVGSFGVYWTRSFPAPAWSADLDMPDLQINDIRDSRR